MSPAADIQRHVAMHDPYTAFAAPEEASYVEDRGTPGQVVEAGRDGRAGQPVAVPSFGSRLAAVPGPWFG